MAIITLDLLYKDGANNKTPFSYEVDTDKFPKAKNINIGDVITMGEFGTEKEEDFFDGDYSEEYDNNLLEVEGIQNGSIKRERVTN